MLNVYVLLTNIVRFLFQMFGLSQKVKVVSDDDGEVITNPDIVSVIEAAVCAYDFSNVNEEVAEIVINEMRESYDCDA